MRQVREFNSTSEAEGSPVACKHAGYVPRILIREDGQLLGVVRFPNGRQRPMEWCSSGRAHWHNNDIDLVLAPLDWVQGKPVFHGDVVYKGRRKVAVNASQMGVAPPWAGATLAPVEPQENGPFDTSTRYVRHVLEESAAASGPQQAKARIKDIQREMFEIGRAMFERPTAELPRIRTKMTTDEWRKLVKHATTAPDYISIYDRGTDAYREQQELGLEQHMKDEISSAVIARAIADGQVVPAGQAAKLDKAIDQVQTAAQRVMLEQVAIRMQKAAAEQVLQVPAWIAGGLAAERVRSIPIKDIVDEVLAPGGKGVQS